MVSQFVGSGQQIADMLADVPCCNTFEQVQKRPRYAARRLGRLLERFLVRRPDGVDRFTAIAELLGQQLLDRQIVSPCGRCRIVGVQVETCVAALGVLAPRPLIYPFDQARVGPPIVLRGRNVELTLPLYQ